MYLTFLKAFLKIKLSQNSVTFTFVKQVFNYFQNHCVIFLNQKAN